LRLEKKATVASSSVATVLVMIKLAVGIMSGSVAILASAIDSLLDLIISLFNYFALHNAEKDPDEKFHFGRSKLEPLAAVIEGTIISISALFILYEAISKLLYPQEMAFMQAGIYVMIASVIITGCLVAFLNYVADKTQNMVIKADALHYKTDLYSNGAVLLALIIIHFTGEEIIDAILGIGIAIYMIYSAVPIIKEGVLMLLDIALEKEEVQKIIQIIEDEPEITNYHYLRTRVSGSHIFISYHAVFNTEISLYNAHTIADKIEAKIKKLFPVDKKVHILTHMDPYDDTDINDEEEEW
jgi:cation diffusion facilitator family transporter